MEGTNKLLLQLVGQALFPHDKKLDWSQIDLPALFNLAEKQTVDGLAYDGLNQQGLKMNTANENVLLDWFSFAEQISSQNVLVNNEVAECVRLLTQQGINYIIVKGQSVGCLYPNPQLRASGDIDIFIKGEYEENRDRIAECLQVKLPERLVDKEVSFERNGIPYDLHGSLMLFATKSHQKYWDSLIQEEWKHKYYVEIGGQQVRTLAPTMSAIYVFVHLFFHFIRVGVGLRQFCDWAIILHYYKNDINRKKLHEILHRLDLVIGYKALGAVLVDDLGLPADDFPYEITEEDRRWKEKILNDVFKGGNMGRENHHAQHSWKYKLETMMLSLKNTFRYYNLSPTEVGLMIPKLTLLNLYVWRKRL